MEKTNLDIIKRFDKLNDDIFNLRMATSMFMVFLGIKESEYVLSKVEEFDPKSNDHKILKEILDAVIEIKNEKVDRYGTKHSRIKSKAKSIQR